MQNMLDRLIDKINAASLDKVPTDNIYMQDVFNKEFYDEILANLPMDSQYHFIKHPDAALPDGTATRKLLDLTESTIEKLNPNAQAFWRQINKMLTTPALTEALMKKFSACINQRYGDNWPEMVPVPILYRDYPGYRIGVHTDAPFKLATMQFYFPKDDTQIHLGTSFHLRRNNQFILLKTNPFVPNAAYAFARTDESWHSVNQLASHEAIRNSLALTIYAKGHEYSSEKEMQDERY